MVKPGNIEGSSDGQEDKEKFTFEQAMAEVRRLAEDNIELQDALTHFDQDKYATKIVSWLDMLVADMSADPDLYPEPGGAEYFRGLRSAFD